MLPFNPSFLNDLDCFGSQLSPSLLASTSFTDPFGPLPPTLPVSRLLFETPLLHAPAPSSSQPATRRSNLLFGTPQSSPPTSSPSAAAVLVPAPPQDIPYSQEYREIRQMMDVLTIVCPVCWALEGASEIHSARDCPRELASEKDPEWLRFGTEFRFPAGQCYGCGGGSRVRPLPGQAHALS
jgi:hypothetical protein